MGNLNPLSFLSGLGNYIGNGFTTAVNYFSDQDKNGNNKIDPEEVGNSAFNNSLGGKIFNGLTTPIGSGENASSALQMGLAGLGILQQKKSFEQQLAEARRQFAFSKGNTQANLMNQGTNFINQGLWQVEALNGFNPNAAAERAQNFGAAVNQMNDAASKIELGPNTFGQQQNALQKYTQLANTPRMA